MKTFQELKKNLQKDFSGLKEVKIAILGDSSTQLLVQALHGTGYEYAINLKIWEAGFDQIESQVLNPGSEMYEFNPEIIIIFRSSVALLNKYNKLNEDQNEVFAQTQLELLENLVDSINSKLSARIIYYNHAEINDSVFGAYANKVQSSFLFQLRKLNYELMLFAVRNSNFYVCDLSSIQNSIGRKILFQSSIYINTAMVLGLDILPEIAAQTLDLISALCGKFKKCVILDLDNTLWGGVIGDDGLESIQIGNLGIGKAFTEFQYWLKKLKRRGIILAVCSKNSETVAKEPFIRHRDMVIRLDDIAVFVANWGNKVDNVRHIQSILNIGFDSIVFLDDNPVERKMVKENISEICVPDLPEDPAEYLEHLYSLNLFETVSFSKADVERVKQYQEENLRREIQTRFTNEDEFLESLNMLSIVEAFTGYNIPRVAQLSQRSNQFNLRTIRYTEIDLEHISTSPDYSTFVFSLEDTLGDNGIVSVIILRRDDPATLFIESWFMSCRVLKRGLEVFALNIISGFAEKAGYRFLKGEFISTGKNDLVRNHYLNLGFKPVDRFWLMSLVEHGNQKCFIKIKN